MVKFPHIQQESYTERVSLFRYLNEIDCKPDGVIIAFHPDTIHLKDNTKYAQIFVRLIQDNPDVFFILVLPNLDAGNKDIIKVQMIPFRFRPPRPVI